MRMNPCHCLVIYMHIAINEYSMLEKRYKIRYKTSTHSAHSKMSYYVA